MMKNRRLFTPHILIGSNLINFFRWIIRLNFSIKWPSITRLFVSLLIVLLLTPFRIIELVLYFFSKKVEVKQPIFIVGHARSGTTFFHDSLNELDDLAAPRMIDCLFPLLNKYFEFMLVPILKKALPETRLMDKMKVRWDSPQEEEFGMALMSVHSGVNFLFAPANNGEIFNKYVLLQDAHFKSKWQSAHLRFSRKIQSMNKGKKLVFKSPGNTARIAELLEIYPDAKFIHIVRDPQDVIRSTLHLYRRILPEFSLKDESKLNLESYVFDHYESVMNKFLESRNTFADDQLFELKYEAFVADPLEVLRRAFTALNITLDPEDLKPFFATRKKYSKNEFQKDPELSSRIRERCKNIIEQYDYS